MKKKNRFKFNKKNNRSVHVSPNPPPIQEDLLVHEILIRLTTKSLVRFRSVCRRWNYIIGEDENFVDLYLTRSKSKNPSLLITTPAPKEKNPSCTEMMFLTCNMIEGGCKEEEGMTTTDLVHFTDAFRNNISTNSINGLICFIDVWDRPITPKLCNLSTRQVTPLVKSTLLEEEREKYGTHVCIANWNYQFGFDPASNEYKLVCFTITYNVPAGGLHNLCEVLTVIGSRDRRVGGNNKKLKNNNNNNRWRRIDNNSMPPYEVDCNCPSVYVNGSIYWTTDVYDYRKRFLGEDHKPRYIIAFDVGSEKFRTIQVPNIIFDEPRKHCEDANAYELGLPPDPKFNLLELDGRLALQVKMSSYVIKLWIFNDEKKENNTTTSSNKNWSEMNMTLPFCWGKSQVVSLHTISNHIILKSFHIKDPNKVYNVREDMETKDYTISLYSFDRKKNIFTQVVVGKIPRINTVFSSALTLFVESILTLPKLSDIAKVRRHHISGSLEEGKKGERNKFFTFK